MRRELLYGLFFLSGVSALAYEILWQRLLHLVFGVSTPAVAVVLTAFMGGLALGGVLLGRWADRTANPLRLYACLEAGIALAAVLVPAALDLLTDGYVRLSGQLALGSGGGTLLRLVIALVVLLVPATLIGGTVPVMSRLALREPAQVPGGFSLLYAVNTGGAVAGAALTGFVLLPHWGMSHTLGLAAGLNLVVALTAGLASRTATDTVPAAASPAPPAARALSPLLLACAVVTGIVTTGLEVAWARILGVFTTNSAYAFALVLTVLLLGLSVGGLLQALWWRLWAGDTRRRLAVCQWCLAGLTLLTLPGFRALPAWLEPWRAGGSTTSLFLAELALTGGALFLPAVLMGMSFPLLVAAATEHCDGFGQRLGRLYAVNTLGCAGGALLAGFVCIPALGLGTTLRLCAAGSLAVGLAAWGLASRPHPFARGAVACVLVLATVGGWLHVPADGYHKEPLTASEQLLYYREGDSGTVSVVEGTAGTRLLLVDGQPVAGTSPTSVTDQKMLAHLPLLLHPAPRRGLTVGFGSGGTSYSMTLHGVAVDCVEIEAAVPGAAAHFRSENHDVLTDPNFRLILDDARGWLRVAPVRYDAIVTDCTNLQYKSSGDLYTVEYFRLLRARLSADGIAAAWVPANGIDPADLKTLLRSFRAVFPHASVWYMNPLPTDFLIVVGTPAELTIDLDRLRQRLTAPAVQGDLEAVGLAEPERLLCTLLTAGPDLERYVGPGPLHTDDQPLLSYSTYGANYRATIARNLRELTACRTDAPRYVQPAPADATLARHAAASTELLLGHAALLAGEGPTARAHYAASANLLPGDQALRRLAAGEW